MEASSYLPQTRSTTFLLILNKYIFTFLCYIHYVNIFKTNVKKKEADLVPGNCGEGGTIQWLLRKKQTKKKNLTFALHVFGMLFCQCRVS